MGDIDLKTLCMYINNNEELMGYFYKMSYSMKKLHDNGYYITDFKSNKIIYNDKTDEFIFNVSSMRPDIRNEVIKSNIMNYASLLTNIYISKSNLFNSDMLLPENYLKEVVENFKYSYSELDYPYFYNLYKNNDVVYYHEYIDAVKKNLSEGRANGSSNMKSMVKATKVGAMLAGDDNEFSKAAFISVPVVFIMAGVLILLMIIIFVFTNS